MNAGQTHYLLPMGERSKRAHTFQAACGEFVSAAAHTVEPSCAGCKAYLEAEPTEDEVAAIVDAAHGRGL